MALLVEPWQPILDNLTKLRGDWPVDGWSWDGRFKCATSSFGADVATVARSVLAAALPSEWTATSMSNAAEDIGAVARRCGDLRSGQSLFTAGAVSGMIPFAMWWPWGDDSQVSVRIGVANSDRPKELYPLVRAIFGIV